MGLRTVAFKKLLLFLYYFTFQICMYISLIRNYCKKKKTSDRIFSILAFAGRLYLLQGNFFKVFA